MAHHPEPRLIAAADPSAVGWQGVCECGWRGGTRRTRHASEDDCCAHLVEVTPRP